ncbi:MAG TPA: glycosyltransferase [Candidatus Acidoferrales bacterium]
MNILQISQTYYPFLSAGGPPTKVRAIATRLALKGHSVTVLTADFGVNRYAAELENLTRCRWGWRSTNDGVETIYLRTIARYRSLTLNPDVIRFAQERLQETDVAHIYGIYDLIGPAIGRYCSRSSVPYVLEPIGMFRPIIRSFRLKRLYHRNIGERLTRGAQFLIATSIQEKQEFLAEGIEESRVVVRRNGIDVPAALPVAGTFRARWAIPQDKKLILYLGRLISKKSPEILIAAFAAWRNNAGRGTPAILVLAGPEEEFSYLRQLKQLSAKLGAERAIRFTGPLYGDEKWAAYRDADVFVLPSQHENFGNTAAESAACGTPVIVTEQCGVAPIIAGRAGEVIRHDAVALEAALTSFLAKQDLRDLYRDGCAQVTRELSWNEPVAEMEELYRRCVEKTMAQ